MGVVHPPYHLRTNKAVDRLTLVRQMQAALYAGIGLSNAATYYSLAGPFMEDVRLIHRAFPSIELRCIESDKQTTLRQEAHRFCLNLQIRHKTLTEFVAQEYAPNCADIFWLDFTDLDLRSISDYQALLRTLLPGSLIRITLRCESPVNIRNIPDVLDSDQHAIVRNELQAAFVGIFDRFLSSKAKRVIPSRDRDFASVLQRIVRLAVSEVFDPANSSEFVHLSSTYYNDGTAMLSVTGVVTERRRLRSTMNKLRRQGADVDRQWRLIKEIDLPFLSVQERLTMNKALPHRDQDTPTGEALYALLNYNIAGTKPKSIAALEQYAGYRHEYPSFVHLEL